MRTGDVVETPWFAEPLHRVMWVPGRVRRRRRDRVQVRTITGHESWWPAYGGVRAADDDPELTVARFREDYNIPTGAVVTAEAYNAWRSDRCRELVGTLDRFARRAEA